MKILVVNAGPVYPVKAMSQMRTHHMIQVLSKDFTIDLLTTVNNNESELVSLEKMQAVGGDFIALQSVKHNGNKLKKRFVQLIDYFNYYFFGIDKEVTANYWYQKKIAKIINQSDYSVVIGNYWETSFYFNKLKKGIFKILDPHYAVGENWDVFSKVKQSGIKTFFEKRRLRKNLKFEQGIISSSDMLLPLSQRNFDEFHKIAPSKPSLLVADGSDIQHYVDFPIHPDPKTILFYGAMGSAQNRGAFWRFYNEIYPAVKAQNPSLKILVVGANPPNDIKELENTGDVIVTGFVKDVREYLGQAWFKILPLELGSGFRGRIIEIMAMGIPVIGTHNALDSVGLTHEKNGFVTDSNETMISCCLKLLNDHEYRNLISKNGVEFVQTNYSLEATFGKLNRKLLEMKAQGKL